MGWLSDLFGVGPDPTPAPQVVSVDDVRVTGVHEKAMDKCLVNAGSATVEHAYIVDDWAARHDPATEAMLNASGVKSSEELLALTQTWGFAPNARFCKRVLSMPEGEMRTFLFSAPHWIKEWVLNAVGLDRLDQYDAYRDGALRLRSMLAPASVHAHVA